MNNILIISKCNPSLSVVGEMGYNLKFMYFGFFSMQSPICAFKTGKNLGSSELKSMTFRAWKEKLHINNNTYQVISQPQFTKGDF